MMRLMILCSCFLISVCVFADNSKPHTAEWCADYQRHPPFHTDIPVQKERGKYDFTGDGIDDSIKEWNKFGSALAISCEDGTSYIPLYSHTGLRSYVAPPGQWSQVELGLNPNTGPEERVKGRDPSVWIDGKLHFFEPLGFNISGLIDFAEGPQLPIYFKKNRYTSDLSYCPAFDLYGYRLRIIPSDLENKALRQESITLMLKSGEYPIVHSEQFMYYFGALTPKEINGDKYKDGYLDYYHMILRAEGKMSAAMLNCGDNSFIYVPDHKIKDMVKRGKEVAAKSVRRHKHIQRALNANSLNKIIAARHSLHQQYKNAVYPATAAEIDFAALEAVFLMANALRKKGEKSEAAQVIMTFFASSESKGDTPPLTLDDSGVVHIMQSVHTRILNDTAFILEQGGQPARALPLLHTVIVRDPKRAVAYLNIADAAKKLNNVKLGALGRIAYATILGKKLPDHIGSALGCSNKSLIANTNIETYFLQVTCLNKENMIIKTQWGKNNQVLTTKETVKKSDSNHIK